MFMPSKSQFIQGKNNKEQTTTNANTAIQVKQRVIIMIIPTDTAPLLIFIFAPIRTVRHLCCEEDEQESFAT